MVNANITFLSNLSSRCGYLTYHIPYPRSLLNRREFQTKLWETYYSNPCNCDPTQPFNYPEDTASPESPRLSSTGDVDQSRDQNHGHHQHHGHHGHGHHHHGQREKRELGNAKPSHVYTRIPRRCNGTDKLCRVLKASRKENRLNTEMREILTATCDL